MAEELSFSELADVEYERIRCRALVQGPDDPCERQCYNAGSLYGKDYYCHVHRPRPPRETHT